MQQRYPQYSQACGWNALLPARDPRPAMAGDTDCDTAIVGAGFTGIAAAGRFAELGGGDDIVLLDASGIGEGNAGRNSGFLLEIALAQDADSADMRRMRRCNELIAATMADIRAAVDRSGRDCGLRRIGTYRAAAGRTGRRALDGYRRFLESAELQHDMLDRDALAARLGTSFYSSGLYSPHCYLAQPAALVRCLAGQLPATVRLYENSPVLTLESTARGWLLTTPRGRVTARRVVIANNAFCKALGIGRSRIVAMYTYAALTKQRMEQDPAIPGSEREWGLLPAHRLGSTLRRTADGRLLIRSFYGYEKETDNKTVGRRLAAALARRYPALAGIEFDHVWGGATGFTYNAAPLWGELDRGLYVSAGCNGGGIVKGTLFGRLLADLAHGRDVPDIHALFGRASRMPPEPLRRLGFAIIAGIERRRARAEV